MTIGEELVQLLLRNEAEASAVCDGADGGGAGVQCAAKSAIAISCTRLWARPAAPPADLRARAERLALRLNYLPEPLRLVELDSISMEALLRSSPPKAAPTGPSYFEITLDRSGAAQLHRYEQPAGDSRRAIAFPLTMETLARVIDDLMAA